MTAVYNEPSGESTVMNPGTHLSHYIIDSKLGEGGMGVVYKARDERLGREVAVKVLPPGKSEGERRLRFEQEARAASALNHPNIITIHEIADADGISFIVMEYVAGRTLDQVLSRGPMRLREMLDIAVPIADALARAHSAGIVHRDLKPANVIVGDGGQVKLLDFGLAKLTEVAAPEPGDATMTMAPLTEEGRIVGTIAYMSPEQTEGRKVDARSDIFSFGAVLYEMATGRRPFVSASRVSTMAAIVNEDPKPVREAAPNFPLELERIIARCLRKDPARRFQSAADLRISLQDIARDIESGAHSGSAIPVAPLQQSSRQPSKARFAGVTLLLCAVTAAATWVMFGRANGGAPANAFEILPLTAYRGQEIQPAISPDGRQVAFAWNGGKGTNFDIYVRLVAGGPALRLTSTPVDESYPTWSPDGTRIAFLRPDGIYGVAALGGAARKIASPQPSAQESLVWTVDGKYLLYSAGTAGGTIWGIPAEGGEARQLTHPEALSRFSGDRVVSIAPNGHSVAIVRWRSFFSHAVLVGELSPSELKLTAEPRAITPYDSKVDALAWTGDSSALIASVFIPEGGTGLWRISLDGARRPLGVAAGAATPTVSRSGNLLIYAVQDRVSELHRIDGPGPDGNVTVPFDRAHPAPLVQSSSIDREPGISPDGRQLIFNSLRTGWNELHLASIDGSDQAALTNLRLAGLGSPRWSPDSTQIVFDGFENGRSVIYTIGAGGGRPKLISREDSVNASFPSWSHDGKWIYFTSSRTGRDEIWKAPAAGGSEQQVTHTGGGTPFASADGTTLFYFGQGAIWRMPVSGGEPVEIAKTVDQSSWGVGGNNVYFRSAAGAPTLMVYRSKTGITFPYVAFPPNLNLRIGGTSVSISRDERTIVYVVVTRNESDLRMIEGFH